MPAGPSRQSATAPLPQPAILGGQLAAALAASGIAGYAIATSGSWELPLGLLGAGALVALGLLRPAMFLIFFLLLRPLLDGFAGYVGGIQATQLGGALLVGLAVTLVTTPSRTLVTPPAAAYGLIVLLSAAGAGMATFDFGGTVGSEPLNEVIRLGALLSLYLLAANVLSSEKRVRWLFVAVALSAVVPAVLAVGELFVHVESIEGTGLTRVTGPFNGPNPLGLFCALTALVLIALPPGWIPGWARIAALIPVLVALTATYSRVGWVFFLVGLVLLEWRKRKRVVLAVVACAAAVVALVPSVQDRVLPANEPGSGEPETYESFGWRIANWGGLLEQAAEQPLIGHGTATTVYVNPRRPANARNRDDGGYQAHNSFVRILVEGGLVLLVAYVLFMVTVFRSARRLARAHWPLQRLGELVLALWLAFTVVALGTDDPFDATVFMFALLAMTAALEGAARVALPPAIGTRPRKGNHG